jgi:23S rRNA (adenine2503-C2)-methyltransferase
MTLPELREFITSMGESAFRAKQLFKWMHSGTPIEEMSNLSKDFRRRLSEEADYRLPKIERKLVSKKDGTIKYLFALSDGECVESVLMKYEHGNTICVSSQAGCRMGCAFCASTLAGKTRDLTPSEILGQVALASRDSGERIHGIVMMGIGEPLDNYDNVIKFLRLVGDEEGLGIGMRHISLSTCGIVPGIRRLADEGIPVTLSVSLHAYDDEKRRAIMPIAKKYSNAELLSACKYYFDKTGRRVSFEYTLISGKNDSMEDAAGLAALLKRGMGGAPCHVNLIMLNEVDETGLRTVDRKSASKFESELKRLGQNATIRRRLGSDVDASCGQLRLSRNRENTENQA